MSLRLSKSKAFSRKRGLSQLDSLPWSNQHGLEQLWTRRRTPTEGGQGWKLSNASLTCLPVFTFGMDGSALDSDDLDSLIEQQMLANHGRTTTARALPASQRHTDMEAFNDPSFQWSIGKTYTPCWVSRLEHFLLILQSNGGGSCRHAWGPPQSQPSRPWHPQVVTSPHRFLQNMTRS